MRSKLRHDHRFPRRGVGALCRPVARRAGAVLLAANTGRRAVGDVAHGGVVDRSFSFLYSVRRPRCPAASGSWMRTLAKVRASSLVCCRARAGCLKSDAIVSVEE